MRVTPTPRGSYITLSNINRHGNPVQSLTLFALAAISGPGSGLTTSAKYSMCEYRAILPRAGDYIPRRM